MSEIAARQPVVGDIDSLIDLCRAGFPDALLWNGPRFLARNWWRSVLGASCAETWVFFTGSEICGLLVLLLDNTDWQPQEPNMAMRLCAAVLSPRLVLSRLMKKVLLARPLPSEWPMSEAVPAATGRRAQVRSFVVAPERRRQGVGRRMLQFCETRAVALGCESIDLEVLTENASARHFYVQQGYVCRAHGRNSCVFAKIVGARDRTSSRATT